jgi:hypothetical protein
VTLTCWLCPVCRTRGRVGDPTSDAENCELFVPEMPTLFKVRSPVAVLGFVMVTVNALLVLPTIVLGKLKLLGVMLEVKPVPERVSDCGLPAALSVMLNCAVRAPEPPGVKVRLKLVVLPGWTVMGVLTGDSWKSAALVPETATLLIIKSPVAFDGFITVTAVAALVLPKSWLAKLRGLGLNVGAPGAVPVPLSVTVSDPAVVLSVMVRVAVRPPAAAGVKVRDRVAELFGATGATLVGVTANSEALVPEIAILEIIKLPFPELLIVKVIG